MNNTAELAAWLGGRDDAAGLIDRLLTAGLAGHDLPELVAMAAEGLCALGLPLLRMHASASTLHPVYGALSQTWERRLGSIAPALHPRANNDLPIWQRSPFFHMLQRRLTILRQRLDRPADPDFAVYQDLREQGGTDYYARLVGFERAAETETRAGVVYSFVAEGKPGFDAADLALIEAVLPALSLAIRSIASERIAAGLLETYVGRDAGRRVLAGQIERGQVLALPAVIYLADLRGFTALAQAMPGKALVTLLDDYLERMAMPVLNRGGEVLKFLGDGLLGVFPIPADGSTEAACLAALAAAEDALAQAQAFNALRLAAGQPHLDLDLVLHRGEVLYGNVGTANRLDFTVIGPAVNEAGRIEALCAPLGRNLLLSEAFVDAAPSLAGRLRPLGQQALRGLPGRYALYALAE
ncbi:MAG: adenylate/guanylate cyclase domain-containing protein [Alphaproteobacteria bacterium]|nr:adenylate/guanylate cyclase domain-containing protein [Alphaproteobacteria bacterium]